MRVELRAWEVPLPLLLVSSFSWYFPLANLEHISIVASRREFDVRSHFGHNDSFGCQMISISLPYERAAATPHSSENWTTRRT